MQWHDHSIARQIFSQAPVGEAVRLPQAGTALENPYVFDSVAREIKFAGSEFGELEVIEERTLASEESLIVDFVFRRLA
ncbi:hypothetical protein [Aquabacterium sp. OR-4]|uniref:hypothetical protein n=1 Tax=Aquabacterium sp. OR-4 TaxID=2978127 RepID=UPI0028CAA37E|nr:hypothetical protein [Aquabacterium sp. OR-4]MDT7838955.1 hypothetical protein [Aquabacterium sp. OR-4]